MRGESDAQSSASSPIAWRAKRTIGVTTTDLTSTLAVSEKESTHVSLDFHVQSSALHVSETNSNIRTGISLLEVIFLEHWLFELASSTGTG